MEEIYLSITAIPMATDATEIFRIDAEKLLELFFELIIRFIIKKLKFNVNY